MLTAAFVTIPSDAGTGHPVQYVKGIGPRLAEILAGKGIHTVDDLLHYLPFRYEDRLNPAASMNYELEKWPRLLLKFGPQACSALGECPSSK